MSSSPSVTSRLQAGPERRRHVRCRVLERQLVTVGLGPDCRGLLVDISESGAAVQPYTELQTGDTSEVRFQLPGSTSTIEAQGVVSWVGPTGRAGIRFTAVPDESQSLLRRWIDGLAPAAMPAVTPSAALATAAYLPPSYSPWVRMSELNVEPSRLDDSVPDLDLVSALRLVVERSRTLTRASGAAIALADKEEMVCRARTGVAPDLGARFRPDSGLSGEAVRTAKTVHCTDTADDPRVDRVACERLNVRSIVITPILSSAAVIGVIEVFSPKAHAFNDRDEIHLRRMADLVAAMLENSSHLEMGFLPDLDESDAAPEETLAADAREEITETFAPAVQLPEISTDEATAFPAQQLQVSDSPEATGTAETVSSTIAPAETRTSEPTHAAFAGLGTGPYPLVPAGLAEPPAEATQPIPLHSPAKESAIADAPSSEQVVGIYQGFMQQANEEDRRRRNKLISIVLLSLALLAIAVAVPFWLVSRKKAAPAVPPQRLLPASTAIEPAPVEPPLSGNLPSPSVVAARSPVSDLMASAKSGGRQTKARGERWSWLAPTKPGTGSELKLQSPQPAPPAPAPEMTSTQNGVKVINDMVGSWGEADPAGSDSRIVEGRLINRVDPIFPPPAKRGATRGRVVVRIGIDKAGHVERTEPVSGDATLSAAAVQAIRQWRYEPYQLDGEPIAVEKTITIDFTSQR